MIMLSPKECLAAPLPLDTWHGEWARAWFWVAEMHLQVLSEVTRLRLKATPIAGASLEVFARAMVQKRFANGLRREMEAKARP
jgi:hypothetical protein